MNKLRPNAQRAQTAILLVYIVMSLEIVSLISGYFQHNLLKSLSAGEYVSDAAASANDLRESMVGFISIIALVISGVTFIQWFRRAYFNLHQKLDYLANSEGWAAGAWFVPFVNLYKPFQIMRELYLETKEYLSNRGVVFQEAFTTNTLGVWWALWIMSSLVSQVVFRLSMDAETVEEFITSTKVSMLGNVLGIPLALITVKVIKDYSKLEVLLHELPEEDHDLSQNEDNISIDTN